MKSLPLYKKIQEDIRFLIRSGQLRPGDRVPSEQELAEQYHVSRITSKNAINGLTEEGVLVRYRGKGTFVNRVLEQFPSGDIHKGVIGLILPSMKTKVDQRIMSSIEQNVREQGYYLLVRITQESAVEESKAIEDFLLLRVKGLIIFPIEQQMYNNDILRLSLDQFPLVLIDRYIKEVETYSVSADNINGTYVAIKDLLNKGHKQIAFITVEVTNTATADRAAGFELAFLEKNLPINKNLWCILNIEDIASGKGSSIIREFLEDNLDITAIFACNAELTDYTHRAINVINQPGYRKPELVSFDQSDLADVSYVKQDVEDMCRITVELLVEQIQGKHDPRRIAVPVKLFHKNILNKV